MITVSIIRKNLVLYRVCDKRLRISLFYSPKLFKCSGCGYVFYCGAQCQSAGWAEHKHECPKLKLCGQAVDGVPDGLRMVAKLVIKIQNGGYQQRSFYAKTESRKFRDLMSRTQIPQSST